MFGQVVKRPAAPVLKEGDKVEFELSCGGQRNIPRWDMNIDTGASGNWAEGFIVSIDDKFIVVEYEIPGFIGSGHCNFPNVGHPSYIPQQWQRGGYLRKIKAPIIPNCDCGSEKTYGKNNSLHSSWCSLYLHLNTRKKAGTFKI